MLDSFELGPIRPPSEAYSLLIRVTRNCSWNRCKFCHTYKGEKFELRPVDDVKRDIDAARAIRDKINELSRQYGYGAERMVLDSPPNDAYRTVALWMYAGAKSAFLQDANTLIMPTAGLVEVIKHLKATFPSIERITSYGRSKTAAKKRPEELAALHAAGLSRLHIGLETGSDALLRYIDKGVTAAEQIAGGKNVVASGISLSEYVILGLGGKKMWREHALETARVLNEINPDFIRVRTLSINSRMPLCAEVANGNFVRQTDEEIVEETKLLIEHLDCHAEFVSDHITNLLQELKGKLPEDKPKLLEIIARFQALTADERGNFRVGRRLGIYSCLDDLNDESRRERVERVAERLRRENSEVGEDQIYGLMEGFI